MSKKHLFIMFFVSSLISLSLFFLTLNTKEETRQNNIYTVNNERGFKFKIVKINNKELKLEIADTQESREQGLSNRETVAFDGMLFVFDRPSLQTFWMKDMNFDLDIIWIDGQNKIIQIDRSVSRFSYNKTNPEFSQKFSSPLPVKYVIELPAGKAQELNFKVGDLVQI